MRAALRICVTVAMVVLTSHASALVPLTTADSGRPHGGEGLTPPLRTMGGSFFKEGKNW